MDIIVHDEGFVHKLIFPGTEQEFITLWTSDQKVKVNYYDHEIQLQIGQLLLSVDDENIRKLGYGKIEFLNEELCGLYWLLCFPFPGAGLPYQDKVIEELCALELEIPKYFIEVEGDYSCLYLIDKKQTISLGGQFSGLPKLLHKTSVKTTPDGKGFIICFEE